MSAESLPDGKPRYLMGVGHQVDLVVCAALGIDMFDCVFPTRTARFGSALVFEAPGELNLRKAVYETDFSPIDPDCPCSTCKNYTRYVQMQMKASSSIERKQLELLPIFL